VRLIASAASTGRKKNTPITSSAGATNHQAARCPNRLRKAWLSLRFSWRKVAEALFA
jgi:hypothetical protein